MQKFREKFSAVFTVDYLQKPAAINQATPYTAYFPTYRIYI